MKGAALGGVELTTQKLRMQLLPAEGTASSRCRRPKPAQLRPPFTLPLAPNADLCGRIVRLTVN